MSCLHGVYLLAPCQNVSVSCWVVFAEWFVIIRRPPMGNASGHLYKFAVL